jgi:hypothetical protein
MKLYSKIRIKLHNKKIITQKHGKNTTNTRKNGIRQRS